MKLKDSTMDKAPRELYAENLFETVRRNYCESNKDYIQKQIQLASDYLTEEQKKELRLRGGKLI